MGGPTTRWNDSSKNHHWWPRCVSKYWRDNEENVNGVNSDDTPIRPSKRRKKIGSDEHWLTVFEKGSEFWPEEKIEFLFDQSDNDFPRILSELESLSKDTRVQSEEKLSTSHELNYTSEEVSDDLYHCVASLIVRSPSFRARIEKTVRGYGSFDKSSSGLQETLLRNIESSFKPIEEAIRSCPQKFCFFADEGEFCFGDGFFHTFNINSAHTIPMYCAGIVPLTPTLAFGFRLPKLSTQGFKLIKLGRMSVENINRLTMGHSCERIFYRSEKPKLSPEFTAKEFKQLQDNKSIWFDEFCSSFGDRINDHVQ